MSQKINLDKNNNETPTFAENISEQNQTFVPPLLYPALQNLEKGIKSFFEDKNALHQLNNDFVYFAGRPTPLTNASRLGTLYGGKIYLKREDLLHGGAHKLNNALGQCHLAKFMGFRNVIAETGAGQHGVATAMAAARLGLSCTVYQGAKDVARQQLNVLRMKLFGATVCPVTDGSGTLKEAVNAAMKRWVADYKTSAYCLGSIVGPHPYPGLVRRFQKVIGEETLSQFAQTQDSHSVSSNLMPEKLPDAVLACVGGGSNAAGIFSEFVDKTTVDLIGCEAAGAASLTTGTPGVLQGMYSLLLQTPERNVASTHSISAGLDYPGVGPWLAQLKLSGRLESFAVSDSECLSALQELAQTEGILCALESAHAVAGAKKYLQKNPNKTVIINLSGRGDKDLGILSQHLKELLS